MARVYVSIGSNIERDKHIRAALDALRSRFGALTVSTIYQTSSVGFEGEDFYNLVASFDSNDAVHEVATTLRAIEAAHGRLRTGGKFASRTLDIDLLLYDDLTLDEPGLQLPRGEIVRYAFVLGPLAEIAGNVRHPVLGRSFSELWAEFSADKTDLRPVQLAQD